jgi:hypothetical protein
LEKKIEMERSSQKRGGRPAKDKGPNRWQKARMARTNYKSTAVLGFLFPAPEQPTSADNRIKGFQPVAPMLWHCNECGKQGHNCRSCPILKADYQRVVLLSSNIFFFKSFPFFCSFHFFPAFPQPIRKRFMFLSFDAFAFFKKKKNKYQLTLLPSPCLLLCFL